MLKKKPKQNREDINAQSKQLKRKRKHKGLPSGSRFKTDEKATSNDKKTTTDPRIGSKKQIPLIVEAGQKRQKPKTAVTKVKPKNLTPEQELLQLENDPYLEKLLDLIDDNEILSAKQQQDLDIMLDRIDTLMNQLGYTHDDEDEQNEDDDFKAKEDIISLLKNH